MTVTASTIDGVLEEPREGVQSAPGRSAPKRAGGAKKKKKALGSSAENKDEATHVKAQFVLDSKAAETIDLLKSATSAANRSEVIRRALILYKVFVEENGQGIVDENGDVIRVLVA